MLTPPEEATIIIPRWWQPALIASSVLIYADTARYLRRDDWISPNAEGIEGILIASVVYLLITGALAFLFHWVSMRAKPSARVTTLASAFGAGAGACVIIALASLAEGMRLPIYGAIAGIVVLTAVVWAVLSILTARPGVLTVAFTGGPLAAAVALAAFQHPFLFDDNRALNSLAASSIYALVTMAAALLAGRGQATARAAAIAVVLVIAGRLPAMIAGIAEIGEADETTIADDRPNLLFIVSDTLRADYCSVNGGPVPTPWLERLAVRGAHFEQAYSLAPWTLPSMIGMFASTYPPSFEAGDSKEESLRGLFSFSVPMEQLTLAERLQHEGYDTAAFVGNALIDQQTGILRGFGVAKARARAWPYTRTRAGVLARAPLLHDAVSVVAPALAPERRIDTTGILTGYARKWLFQRDESRPFFLFIHYMDPHAPYTPPPAYRLSSVGWPFDADPPLSDHTGRALSRDQLQYVADYAGEIRYVDASAGTLLEGTGDAAGNTLIVFTSDHGEEFWDHGGVLHGHTLYQEQIHVPLIITGPGVAERRITEPVSHIDLIPTIAGLLGQPQESSWRGRNRAAWLRGEAAPDFLPPVFAQSTMLRHETEPLQAVIDGDLKRIRSKAPVPGWLFDLADDPGELLNLEDSDPEAAASLDSTLDAWERSFPSTFREWAGDSPNEALMQERLEQMEALGYL